MTPTTNSALVATTSETYHAQLVNEALNVLDDALRTYREPAQMRAALAHAERRLTDLGAV